MLLFVKDVVERVKRLFAFCALEYAFETVVEAAYRDVVLVAACVAFYLNVGFAFFGLHVCVYLKIVFNRF